MSPFDGTSAAGFVKRGACYNYRRKCYNYADWCTSAAGGGIVITKCKCSNLGLALVVFVAYRRIWAYFGFEGKPNDSRQASRTFREDGVI